MDNLFEWGKPELIWFVLGFVFLLLEFMAPGLIIFFFGAGAWVVALICLFTDISLNVQLTIFLFSSLLLIGTLRKFLKSTFIGRISSKQKSDEVSHEYIGQKATVTKTITPGGKGRVEFHGSEWDAESEETVEEGTNVEIVEKNNITFIVKPV